jgi:hypothetical protein
MSVDMQFSAGPLQRTSTFSSIRHERSNYVQNEYYTEQEKSDQRWKNMRDFVIYSLFAGICLGFPLESWDEAQLCNVPIGVWLVVYSGIYFLNVFQCVAVLMALLYAENPKRVKVVVESCFLIFV